jgi:hypothetical protein
LAIVSVAQASFPGLSGGLIADIAHLVLIATLGAYMLVFCGTTLVVWLDITSSSSVFTGRMPYMRLSIALSFLVHTRAEVCMYVSLTQETARGEENLRFRTLLGAKGRLAALWDMVIGQGLLTVICMDVYPIAMAVLDMVRIV